ncbi:Hypothetical predicted protein, partial [Cloeon dipterum]
GDYDQAKGFCESKQHTRLPIIETREELDVVHAKADSISGVAWWLDASDIGQEPGQFKWSNGNELPLKQPDSYGQGLKTEDVPCLFHVVRQ